MKVAVLRRIDCKSKANLVHVKGQRPAKPLRFWPFRKSTHRAKNALGTFRKVLHKSMTAVRRQFNDNFLKTFLNETTQTVRKLIMATKQQIGLSGNVADSLEKPSIVVVALNLLHRFFCLCVRFVLVKVHGEHGPSMPPIDDLLLLESATSIAEKIRTKKVNIHKRVL